MTSAAPRPPHTIAVLGAGRIGQALTRHWAAAGHQVVLGSRHPERLVGLVAELGEAVDATDLGCAARRGDVALLSVPYEALRSVCEQVRASVAGKVVVDATNPVTIAEGRLVSMFPPVPPSGRRTARLLPGSAVARGFSHVMDELLLSRGSSQPGLWAIAHAADDPEARGVVAALIGDAGFVPVDLGGLDDSGPLDPGGVLFPHMFTEVGMREALAAAAPVARVGT